MSKVIEPPKIKPIVCGVCGCKYEFEKGDKITALLEYAERDAKGNLHRQVLVLNLPCPVCGENNNIVFAEKSEQMTNREYLNSLPNDKFTDLVLAKEAEFHCNNFDPELDIFDITDGTRIDFAMWLAEEYKESEE